MIWSSLVGLAFLAATATAHGDINAELIERRRFLDVHTNNLDHCASKHKARGLDDRAAKRRADKVASLLAARGLQARQVSTVGQSHASTQPFNASTDPKVVFGDVAGESVRSQLIDDQVGVPLHVDIQVIDVNTCEPLQGIFLEMWNANSTGVYSGALSMVNGDFGMQDKANLNKGFLRGAQMTDADGAVQFTTIFPGHYVGRATHLHVITHHNVTPAANGTLWNTKVSHVGQTFFDQALIDRVEKLAPYSTNKQAMTKNAADAILLQEAATADPFYHYVLLGDGSNLLKDGIFAWFSFGVNTTFTRGVMRVADRYKEGGKVATDNPKLPGFAQLFPGGFPTSWQPGFGPSPTPKP